MERKILLKDDSKRIEKLISNYIHGDTIELFCDNGIIVIVEKKLQCSYCGCVEECTRIWKSN